MKKESEVGKNFDVLEIESQKPSITVIGQVAKLTAGKMTDRTDGATSHDGYKPASISR